jgi:hypothetical protein
MFHELLFPRRAALLGVLASLAAVGLAIPTTAGATVTGLTSCQTAGLTMPKYRLDADLNISPTADYCFKISGSNVSLNLNGHTINQGAEFGVLVTGAYDRIVGPGTITGGDEEAIELQGTNGSVRGVTLTNNTNAIMVGLLAAPRVTRSSATTP